MKSINYIYKSNGYIEGNIHYDDGTIVRSTSFSDELIIIKNHINTYYINIDNISIYEIYKHKEFDYVDYNYLVIYFKNLIKIRISSLTDGEIRNFKLEMIIK